MDENNQWSANTLVKIDHYKFSGLDSSLIGAIKSTADFYQMPLSAAWIYGMTGLAFLHVIDERLVEPNGGPPEPEVFRLVRNIGLEVSGLHAYAEGEDFKRLQAEAWEKAKRALRANHPVFSKNIDIQNQTSVVYAHDDHGYYTYNWHTGYEHSEDAIPWSFLGLSRCPCINCVKNGEKSEQKNKAGGLISLHSVVPIQAVDERTAFIEALDYVIRLNEDGAYRWQGKTYLVGAKAYERWLDALERETMDKYYFSLFIEILCEARSHAVQFLTELKGTSLGMEGQSFNELIHTYRQVVSRSNKLKEMYPYQEPREREVKQKEQCITIVKELMALENDAFSILKDIYAGGQ
ncbi:hypothetical protein AB4Z17_27960 [Paenibacillus sp. TAF43_2]|uniref:hypothetical protein n=1 Tax=Paenibacillus sp. TAF43_2 TaxID=3233069 RepID=UPI003F97B51E